MNLISVILPVYNCEHTIEKAIDSIINQTYTNWELVICDDCSTDGTLKILNKYRDLYPHKIVILKNDKNMMIAKTLNKCLQHVKGDYIARMDGDDVSLPCRLEKELNFLKNNPDKMVVDCSMIIFDENGNRGLRKGGGTKKNEFNSYFFNHPTIMARKEMYKELNGYSEDSRITRCEDVDLWFRFTSLGMVGGTIEEPLYMYKESKNDYKKRTFKKGLDCAVVIIRGCKLLGTPKWKYVYLIKPIIGTLIPTSIMRLYHYVKDNLIRRR